MARTQLKIATCNLYNLNEPGLGMYTNSNGWDIDAYNKKISWSADKVSHIKADVFGFQELWHESSLDNVFDLAGLLSEYTLLSPPNHTGQKIVCAAAVRSDILVGDAEWIMDFPDNFNVNSQGDDPQTPDISVKIDSFSRPVLHFKIKPRSNGKEISVFVCHLKSKRPTQIYREQWYKRNEHSKHQEALGSAISTIRRTAEAAALRMIITELTDDTDTPVIVLGDLNDGEHSNTLNIITGQPNYLVTKWSTGGSDNDLYSTGTLQKYRSQRDVYYTHIHQKTKSTLDHILVSQEFYDNSKKRIWGFKGMEIFNDHLNTESHKEDGSTDHGIVVSEFEYRPL